MSKIVIIGDETHNRDTLRKLLASHCPQVSVVGEASSVKEGIKAIQLLHPDLVFLDIHLHDGTGFDILHALPSKNFTVIFVSAFDKYTIQAFRLSGVDYLLKPVNPEELIAAVARVKKAGTGGFDLHLKKLDLRRKW